MTLGHLASFTVAFLVDAFSPSGFVPKTPAVEQSNCMDASDNTERY